MTRITTEQGVLKCLERCEKIVKDALEHGEFAKRGKITIAIKDIEMLYRNKMITKEVYDQVMKDLMEVFHKLPK